MLQISNKKIMHLIMKKVMEELYGKSLKNLLNKLKMG